MGLSARQENRGLIGSGISQPDKDLASKPDWLRLRVRNRRRKVPKSPESQPVGTVGRRQISRATDRAQGHQTDQIDHQPEIEFIPGSRPAAGHPSA